MLNIFGNVNTKLLERFEKDLLNFFNNHKEFYDCLIKIIYKYTDDRFRYGDHYSYKYRLLFRIMTDRLRDGDIIDNIDLIKEMKKDINYLRDNFENDYNEFIKKIKLHVDINSNGYTWAVRIMFGFSVEEALKGNSYLYQRRKFVLFEFLDKMKYDKELDDKLRLANIFYLIRENSDILNVFLNSLRTNII